MSPAAVEVLDQVQLRGGSAPASVKLPTVSAAESREQTRELLQELFGPGVDQQQLLGMVQDCLPQATPIVKLSTYASAEGKPSLGFQVDWRDDQAEQLASTTMVWSKRPDGALSLQWRDVWLDPGMRQEGFFEKLADSQIQFLQQHTQHPESELTLSAGGSGKVGQAAKEIVGKYLWARLGLFEFADESNRQGMAVAFSGWIAEKAQENPNLTPDMVQQLQASAQKWTRPDQFAELDIPYIKVPIERQGRSQNVPLGKAFLLDPKTRGWHGRCLINQIEPGLLERAQRALAFGGRSRQGGVAQPHDPLQLAAQLSRQASDLSLPATQRQVHASSLAALTGQAGGEDFAHQFADLGSRELLAEAWETTVVKNAGLPPAQLVTQAAYAAMEQGFVQLTRDFEERLGGKLDPDWVRSIRVGHFGDLSSQRELLEKGASQHLLAAQ